MMMLQERPGGRRLSEDILEQLGRETLENPASVGQNTPNLENILSGESDAATLRQMLLQSGMDANMLNQFSDEELISAYKDILMSKY